MSRAVEVALALLAREGRWFLQRRDAAASHLPGLWEFPGGKVEPGETPEQALRRELREELGWSPGALRPLDPLRHVYADRTVLLLPFSGEGPSRPRTPLAWGWFTALEAARLAVPEANGSLVTLLARLGPLP
ncbi:MAG TPA: NUDIX domain-containing protein [Holophagaceae bacterium]|nr:NUDIX domain-containing protein [Holophagaceae bacterium]